LLQQIQQLWSTRREDISSSAVDIHSRLEQAAVANHQPAERDLSAEVLRQAGLAFKQSYDAQHGGFGSAPKFPQPSQPQFLLRYAGRFNDEEATRMVLHTCERMAAGGIRDQLGGGFARYSVDAEWLVPHFEKMLYDNAQLAQLYLDAYLVSGDPQHADVVRDILEYVLREMTHPDGGFYSAEDADSEGQEGKFYCWTREELSKLLMAEEFNVATRYFGITEQGNFIDHSHPQPLAKQNVLSVAEPDLGPGDRELLGSAKTKMLAERARRVRPHLDDKILVSWNGLMMGAMARASAVLGERRYREAAERNLAFLLVKLWDAPTRALYHRWRDGERDAVQLLEGYGFLLAGVVDLYETTLEPKYLEFALALAEATLARFYDAELGGFWQTAAGASDLILKLKEDYDGAEPSGNSVVCLAFLKLGRITGRDDLIEAAQKTLRLFASRLERLPQAVPYMLQALDFALDEPTRSVVAGEPARPDTQTLIRAIHSVYRPNSLVLGNAGPIEAFAKTLPARNGTVVYVCTGTACQAPTSDPNKVKELLRTKS
jgi:uncharacterized protein YyaL (SSP411 family)